MMMVEYTYLNIKCESDIIYQRDIYVQYYWDNYFIQGNDEVVTAIPSDGGYLAC